jgi:GTPase SAR1 family protein
MDGQSVKLQIWDTAGQERFRSIAKAYFRNALGVILDMWLNDVDSLCDPTAVVILIGNKSDLAASRSVTLAEAEQYAQHYQLTYLETSGLSGENVREAFRKVPKAAKAAAPTVSPTAKSGGCCE